MGIQKQHEDFDLWWEGNAIAMMCEEDEALKIWQAAKAQAVPEGYVVVPKEPTREMMQAVVDEVKKSGHLVDFYKAMIEAVEQNQ